MTQRQKQKSLLIDPSNRLHFNVAHENIHMRKIKSTQGENSTFSHLIPPSPVSNGNNKLYYSVVEKQSQSGISFNNRLFFLKDDDSFGYVSKADLNFDIQSAKQTIPLKSLRKVVPKGKILSLQFQVRPTNIKQSDKIIQKKWVLRMRDKKMADAWTDIINYQISQISSRKSTVQKQQNVDQNQGQQQNLQTRGIKQDNRMKYEQPIANERPQQDYITIQKYDSQTYFPQQQSQYMQKNKTHNEINQSPIKQQRSQNNQDNDEDIQLSPSSLSSPDTYNKSQNNQQRSFYDSPYNNSPKNNKNFILQSPTAYNQREYYQQKTYYEQIEEDFKIKNIQLKQKLYLPSFINYFRPYLDKANSSKTFLLQIDKKYEDFITFCELTSKQFIDIDDYPLYEFRLANRFITQRQTLNKDKLLKQMTQMYEKVFRKPSLKSMDIEGLLLLFENILYVQLEDVQIVVPLMQLKNLPMQTGEMNLTYSSGNKVCQTSLIVEFQNLQKNFTYIYQRILNDQKLRQHFIIPMGCQIQYKGFNLFFRSKVNENLSKLNKMFDSTQELQNISIEKTLTQKSQFQSIQSLYKRLGQILYVNSDLFQHETHTKIIPFKSKINQSAPEQAGSKFIIMFADILPYLSTNELLNSHIFSTVHNPQFLRNRPKQTIPLNKSISQTSSRFKGNSRFVPSQSQSKSISKLNKSPVTQLPYYNHFISLKQNDIQMRYYKEQINNLIKQVAQQFDKFQISIIHPVEINQILQNYHLSHKSLGKIIQQISTKNSFTKSILKSQIAAQCAKLILLKKSQQLLLSPQISQQQQHKQPKQQQNLTSTLTTLLNLILGKYQTKQTQMIWKVLTLHAQVIYGLSIFQKDIHKGYFILSLVSKLNMIINPNTGSTEDIFKNDRFILAIKFQTCRTKPVNILSKFILQINQSTTKEILLNKADFVGIQTLITQLGLSSNSMPYFIKRNKTLHTKILSMLTQTISPTNLKYSHLNLYQTKSLNFTQIQGLFSLIQNKNITKTASGLIKEKQLSLKRQSWEDNFTMYLKRKLRQIQHKITEKVNFNFVKEIQSYIKEIKIFYENHPFISQLLEFLSDYYVSKYDCQNGLQCLKVSLANMISICQGNTNHCRLAKVYLKIGTVYEKMKKFQQSLNQYKKAKHCLQVNQQDNTQLYAFSLIKMAKATLQIDEKNISEALNYAIDASKSLQSMQKQQFLTNTSLLIEAYQIQAKCLRAQQNLDNLRIPQSIDIQTRPEHYFSVLERVLVQQNNIQNNSAKKDHSISLETFQRFMRLILPYYFCQLSDKAAQMMMTYMCELSQNISKKGGVVYNEPLKDDELSDNKHINKQKDTLFYPSIKTNNINDQQSPSINKVAYNIFQAENFIKQQIYNGSFIIQLIEYIDKADDILSLIKKQIKINFMNKTQSKSSSRMYLMSAKGFNESQSDRIFSHSDEKAKRGRKQSWLNDESDPFALERLLDFSKEGKSVTQKDIGYSNRQRKFDSLIRALLVLLGDGFMLHIFEQ